MRVCLDAMRRSDLERFAAWFSEPSLLALLVAGVAVPFGLEDEEAWFEAVRARQREGGGYVFAVRPRQDGGVTGTVGVTLGPFRHTGEFGIAIADPGARGHGFGREASELRLRFAFDEGGLHRVELHVFDFNEPAKRLYRSLGFRAEGRRREVLYRDGRYHDDVRMAMLVDEYRAREGAAPPPGWIPATLRAAPPGGA